MSNFSPLIPVSPPSPPSPPSPVRLPVRLPLSPVEVELSNTENPVVLSNTEDPVRTSTFEESLNLLKKNVISETEDLTALKNQKLDFAPVDREARRE